MKRMTIHLYRRGSLSLKALGCKDLTCFVVTFSLLFLSFIFVSLAHASPRETKTVNSWFQNKRAASSKKKSSARTSTQDLPTIATSVGSSKPSEYEDAFDEPSFLDTARSSTLPKAMKQVRSVPDLGHPMHVLPSTDQEIEPRKLFNSNPQSTDYESQIIAEKIGLFVLTLGSIIIQD
jgi:hypothetical protein